MPTIKQRRAFDKILENAGNVSKSMTQVGYAPGTARNPKELTDSIGYQELLREAGLTEDLIATSLVEDIKAKPLKRIAELNLGAEVLGMKKREPIGNNNVLIIQITDELSKKRGFKLDDINTKSIDNR